ncbi:NADAR family protein [Phanerochaete sordida]|uniref:NADAR family protein n=1 Tax=Phanerochaete sordida TaxID=48140 RepID=A0A9P3GJ76_9APHY|nr:NADAR family protein [Phanerochaete sordida]
MHWQWFVAMVNFCISWLNSKAKKSIENGKGGTELQRQPNNNGHALDLEAGLPDGRNPRAPAGAGAQKDVVQPPVPAEHGHEQQDTELPQVDIPMHHVEDWIAREDARHQAEEAERLEVYRKKQSTQSTQSTQQMPKGLTQELARREAERHAQSEAAETAETQSIEENAKHRAQRASSAGDLKARDAEYQRQRDAAYSNMRNDQQAHSNGHVEREGAERREQERAKQAHEAKQGRPAEEQRVREEEQRRREEEQRQRGEEERRKRDEERRQRDEEDHVRQNREAEIDQEQRKRGQEHPRLEPQRRERDDAEQQAKRDSSERKKGFSIASRFGWKKKDKKKVDDEERHSVDSSTELLARAMPERKASRPQLDESTLFFYEKDQPFYEFTNFAAYPVMFEGKEYPTSEHLFQAQKFISKRPDLAERIRTAPTSREALSEATRLRRLQRSDWFEVNISVMEDVVAAKFTQHPYLRDMLLGTGNRELVEASPIDAFWGYGKDKRGRNELGKALMRVRDRLRADMAEGAGVPRASVSVDEAASQSSIRYVGNTPTGGGNHIQRPLSPRASVAYTAADMDSASQSPTSTIYFYERNQPYFEFTNFSPHAIWFGGKSYPTSEHLFQAHKFLGHADDLAEQIRMQPTSRGALAEATRLRPHQRSDWFKVNISVMEDVIQAKFTQHTELRALLLSTGEHELVEASPVDAFWGYGKDMKGRNELGKALMRLRTLFREQDALAAASPANAPSPHAPQRVAGQRPQMPGLAPTAYHPPSAGALAEQHAQEHYMWSGADEPPRSPPRRPTPPPEDLLTEPPRSQTPQNTMWERPNPFKRSSTPHRSPTPVRRSPTPVRQTSGSRRSTAPQTPPIDGAFDPVSVPLPASDDGAGSSYEEPVKDSAASNPFVDPPHHATNGVHPYRTATPVTE